jgi:hypothetical protein
MAFICSARVARVAVRPLSWEKLRPEPRKAEKSWEMGRDEKNWEVRYPLHPNLGCVHPLFACASEHQHPPPPPPHHNPQPIM